MTTEEKIYRPKVLKPVLFGLGCLIFVVGGIFMIPKEPIEGWFVTIFFGLCLLSFVIQIIPGSSQLKLTDKGLEVTIFFCRYLTRWEDVGLFKLGYLGGDETIKFDYVEGHRKYQTRKMIAKKLSGSHCTLTNTYGLKASELLYILNEWKAKYGA